MAKMGAEGAGPFKARQDVAKVAEKGRARNPGDPGVERFSVDVTRHPSGMKGAAL
ncbi:MAG TPA: hypothetical protein VGD53_14060 [Actinoallomurus sp.]|jgi:hypothetical protein